MMDRLRSSIRTLGVIATTVVALSLAGIGVSHARPSAPSPSAAAKQQSCNAVCRAYMDWSHRVTALFHPSRPVRLGKAAASHGRSARMMLARHVLRNAPGNGLNTRRPGLNSFAQWPAQGDAAPGAADTRQAEEPPPATQTPVAAETPQAAATVQAETAPRAEATPFRPIDQIADRFPTIREFLTRQRADTDSALNAAADSTAFTVTGPVPRDASASDADIRLIAALLIALSTLPTLRFFRQVDRLARRRPAARAGAEA